MTSTPAAARTGARSQIRIGALLLLGALVAVLAVSASSVVNNGTRLGLVVGVGCGVVGLVLLARRFRALWALVGVIVVGVVVVGVAPVRTSGDALQARLAVEARAYEGVPYVWGGESKIGIDCSGLPRSALRSAAVTLAAQNLDPGLLRVAALSWLVDVPAKGMLAGRGTTGVLATADRAGLLPKAVLTPGTLIADGSHVMVVLDENTVIEADPGPNKVIVAPLDDLKNPWMTTKVAAVRFSSP